MTVHDVPPGSSTHLRADALTTPAATEAGAANFRQIVAVGLKITLISTNITRCVVGMLARFREIKSLCNWSTIIIVCLFDNIAYEICVDKKAMGFLRSLEGEK